MYPFEAPAGAASRLARAAMSRRSLLTRSAFAAAAIGLTAACGGSSSPTSSSSGTVATTTSTTAAGSGGAATPTTGVAAATPGSAGSSASPAASPVSGSASFRVEPAKNKGGKLVEGTFADAKTVNPVLESDTSSGRVISLMFDSLVNVDPQIVQPVAHLASKWDISSDGLIYTFTLRDGVNFQDGQPLSSDDVKFTYDLLMNKATGSPRTSELTDRVKSVDAKDPKTVVMTLNHATAPFLVSNVAGSAYGIMPKHILESVDPASLKQHDFSTGKKGVTIGTGPFQFQEWVKDDHMTLAKFPGYFLGEPNLDQYIYKVVPNQTVISQQLKTGELDFGAVQPADLQDMQKQSSVTVVPYDTFGFTFYAYQLDSTKSSLFQDKAVRQALLYALDRKAIVDAVYFGEATVAIGTEPVISWAYAPDQITNKYAYDQNKANQLLDQAGWAKGSDGIRAKNGQKLSFKVWTNSGNQVREQYVTIFQQQWKKIGVDATPQTEEWNAFLDRITNTHDFEIFLVGFSWDVDPDQTTMWSSDAYQGGFNMNKYSNPQVDKLLKDALVTSDINQRKQLYIQMQNLVLDDLPSAILDFPKSLAVVNKRVHNLFPNAVDVTFNAYQWWVAS